MLQPMALAIVLDYIVCHAFSVIGLDECHDVSFLLIESLEVFYVFFFFFMKIYLEYTGLC